MYPSRFSLRGESGKRIAESWESGFMLYKCKLVTLGICGTSEVTESGPWRDLVCSELQRVGAELQSIATLPEASVRQPGKVRLS